MKLQFSPNNFVFGLFGFILLLPFFKPNYFYVKMPELNTLFTYYLYGAIAVIFAFYFLTLVIYKRKPSLIIVLVVLYSVTLVLSTYVNRGALATALIEGASYIALFMISEMLLEKSLNLFLNVVTPILNLLIIINFITILLWPNGMYTSVVVSEDLWSTGNNWFLGYDNAFIAYILPALLFTMIKDLYIQKSFFSGIEVAIITYISLYSIISKWQATAVVCIVIFLVVSVFIFVDKLPPIANSKTYIWGNIAIFLGFVVLRIQDFFAYLIRDILGKNLTFSGRTRIWDASIKSFYNSPVFGYGIEDLIKTVNRLTINSSHNQYLWVLYRGGIVHFIPFLGMLLSVTNRLYPKRSIGYVKLTAIALCMICLMWQFEAITTHALMFVFVFAYYVGYAPLKEKLKINWKRHEIKNA